MRYLLLTTILSVAFAAPAYASEISGTVTTGVQTGVEGTVAATPVAAPAAGTFTSAQSVTLTATGANSIRYTIDTATPLPSCTNGTVYSGAISVSSSLTIRAIGCYNGTASQVGTFAYGININIPAPPPPGGGGGGGGGPIPPSTPAQSNGDLNNDGVVGIFDFNSLIIAWGTTGPSLAADLNRDGVVDVLDFNVLIVNWSI